MVTGKVDRTMVRRLAWICVCILNLSALSALGDSLDRIRESGKFRWGADLQGGGPFIYPDPKDPRKLIGFEVELADLIAKEWGVRAEYRQSAWDQLPLLLERRECDFILNAMEASPALLGRFACSRPYYCFGYQLVAKDEGPIRTWSDLEHPPAGRRFRLGALAGSEVDKYVRNKLGNQVELVSYENSPDAMMHVESGLLDATIGDDCIMMYYIDRYPRLRFIDRPAGVGYYVAVCNPDDAKLRDELNRILNKLISSGAIEQLYDRYRLNGRQQSLFLRSDAGPAAVNPLRGWQAVLPYLSLLLRSALMTVFLSVSAMPLAMLLGLGVVLCRLYGPLPIRTMAIFYIELIRGTPLMLQLYAIFFLLPMLGLSVPALLAAIAGLAINYSACEAENFRAGIQAIPVGQTEAALALGMSRRQAIRLVILPQAFRVVLPPITNDFIALFKDTAVCSVVTVVELTKQYNVLAQSTGAIIELAAVTSLLYLLMSYPLALFARWSETKLAEQIKAS